MDRAGYSARCKLRFTRSYIKLLCSRIEFPVNRAIESLAVEVEKWLLESQQVRQRKLSMVHSEQPFESKQ